MILLAGFLAGLLPGLAAPSLPLRIETEGFEASEADIRAVLESATATLLPLVPAHKADPVLVKHGAESPITLFQRSPRGEIVVALNTGKTYWAQYSYQWSHELCHILCGCRDDARDNKWVEETLCETASLFALRAMARSWAEHPPYPNWKSFAPALRRYTDDVAASREKLTRATLPGFVNKHAAELKANPTARELNGAVAVVLLEWFEEKPSRWAAVHWLNTTPAQPGLDLDGYFRKWRQDAPPEHRATVQEFARLLGAKAP